MTVAPVAWSLLTELGFGVRRVALRVAPLTAVALAAVIGLAGMIGGWTYLSGSSPSSRHHCFAAESAGPRGLVVGWATPDVRTRREFDDIVAHSFAAPDDERPR